MLMSETALTVTKAESFQVPAIVAKLDRRPPNGFSSSFDQVVATTRPQGNDPEHANRKVVQLSAAESNSQYSSATN